MITPNVLTVTARPGSTIQMRFGNDLCKCFIDLFTTVTYIKLYSLCEVYLLKKSMFIMLRFLPSTFAEQPSALLTLKALFSHLSRGFIMGFCEAVACSKYPSILHSRLKARGHSNNVLIVMQLFLEIASFMFYSVVQKV